MTRADPIRVVIADDHALVRSGLGALLHNEQGFEVAGLAADGEEALAITRQVKPDILLLDVSMPRLDGLGGIAALEDELDHVRVLLLSAGVSTEVEAKAVALGARGLILKGASADLLFRSLRGVMAGEYWVRRDAIGDLVRALEHAAPRRARSARKLFGLSNREIAIVQLVAGGYSNKEIAAAVGLSAETIKHHISSIFDKAGVSSRVELTTFAFAHGLIEPAGETQ